MANTPEYKYPEYADCTYIMGPDGIPVCARAGCQARFSLENLKDQGNSPGTEERRNAIIADAKAAGCTCDLENI